MGFEQQRSYQHNGQRQQQMTTNQYCQINHIDLRPNMEKKRLKTPVSGTGSIDKLIGFKSEKFILNFVYKITVILKFYPTV